MAHASLSVSRFALTTQPWVVLPIDTEASDASSSRYGKYGSRQAVISSEATSSSTGPARSPDVSSSGGGTSASRGVAGMARRGIPDPAATVSASAALPTASILALLVTNDLSNTVARTVAKGPFSRKDE